MVVTVGLSWVLNFANAVLGVGLLTMPYCYQECGVVCTTMMILLCGHLTKITCAFLLRAGIYTRKSTYEQLALLVYGPTGKLICEISMIGVVVGTLIAFQVVIGDLAPAIMVSELGFEKSWLMRAGTMIACCGLVLPLSLMRSVSSLASFNAISMTFYVCYIFSVVCLALPTITAMDWWTDIWFWKPVEFFKCLPIILLSYNCQGQIFIFYAALPDPNVKVMTAIVHKAINLVNTFYITVGLFGYMAFYKAGVGGNILENFSDGFFTDCMKLGFLGSVIISFPLMCFPVRSSLNSLLFADKKQGVLHDVITNSSGYIAPDKFVLITLGLVSSSVVVGILIPKVEVVLNITGALAGSFICLVYPTALFLKTGGKDKQRKIAVAVLLLSVFFMIACTSKSLSGLTSGEPAPVAPKGVVKTDLHDVKLIKPELPMEKMKKIEEKMEEKLAPTDIIEKDFDIIKGKNTIDQPEEKLPLKAPKNVNNKEIPHEEAAPVEDKKTLPDIVPDVDKKPPEHDREKIAEDVQPTLPQNPPDKVEEIAPKLLDKKPPKLPDKNPDSSVIKPLVSKADSHDAGTSLTSSKEIAINDTNGVSKAENVVVLKSNKSEKVDIVEKAVEVVPLKELVPEKPVEVPAVNTLNGSSGGKGKLIREILSKH